MMVDFISTYSELMRYLINEKFTYNASINKSFISFLRIGELSFLVAERNDTTGKQ